MARFEGFVILADMRTGSNALEEKLNDFEGLTSHGELFNPTFIGRPGTECLFDATLKQRDAEPINLIRLVRKKTKGLAGFRLFSDHDPRVLDHVLADRATAKIILTRAPVDSYVSLKIARTTGQWWLGDMKRAKTGKAQFVPSEFEAYLANRSAYLAKIRHRLQETGQTSFDVQYEDLGDDAVIKGLARWLGASEEREEKTKKGRVQNPVSLSEKVENFAEMKAALQARDPFDLDAIPDFEGARGPNVPSYLAAQTQPILYMPVKSAADREVAEWLESVDGGAVDALEQGFSQKTLRAWKRRQGAHVSFTVVTHPVVRAHRAFCRFILATDAGAFSGIRSVLMRSYGVPLPDDPSDPGYDPAAHGDAFLAFLKFLKGNLTGQTAVRVDAAWASQCEIVQGFAHFGMPDAVLRADRLSDDLPWLTARIGAEAPGFGGVALDDPYSLSDIYSDKIERAARAAYQRDYMMFGYGPWAS